MPLSDDEINRIEEEERVRAAARAKAERKPTIATIAEGLGSLGQALILLLIAVICFVVFFPFSASKTTARPTLAPDTKSLPADLKAATPSVASVKPPALPTAGKGAPNNSAAQRALVQLDELTRNDSLSRAGTPGCRVTMSSFAGTDNYGTALWTLMCGSRAFWMTIANHDRADAVQVQELSREMIEWMTQPEKGAGRR
jgi:hypothetical protein